MMEDPSSGSLGDVWGKKPTQKSHRSRIQAQNVVSPLLFFGHGFPCVWGV